MRRILSNAVFRYSSGQGEFDMEISATTKIDDLLKEYPFLEDYLVTLSPKFKGLRNPIMRKTLGKVAGIGGLEQALMDEGLPAEEIKRLCDVHVEIFKEALEEQDRPEPPR